MNTLQNMYDEEKRFYIIIITVYSIIMAFGGIGLAILGAGDNFGTVHLLAAISTSILSGLYAIILIAVLYILNGQSQFFAFIVGGMLGAGSGAVALALMAFPIMFFGETFLDSAQLNQYAYNLAHLPLPGFFFGGLSGGVLGAILSQVIYANKPYDA